MISILRSWPALGALLLGVFPLGAQEAGLSKDETQFWALIEKVRAVSTGFALTIEAADGVFSKEKPAALASFWKELDRRLEESYRWDIWAVGAILDGKLGADFSRDYRLWIILQGPTFFRAVLEKPIEALKGIPPERSSPRFDVLPLMGVPRNVYFNKTGRDLPDLDLKRNEREPAGKKWTWQDLKSMHMGLWERFFEKRDLRLERPKIEDLKDEDLVDRATALLLDWMDIYEGPEYLDEQYKRLNPGQRALHAVWWMKAESDNGGIDQFFYNSTGVVAPEAVKGLKLFGEVKHRDELVRIMAAFPTGQPDRDTERRRAQIEKRWRSSDKTIDDEFPGPKGAEDLESVMARYIRAHPEEFFREK
jgi:hypothetical protein